jgi:hypothetical protein
MDNLEMVRYALLGSKLYNRCSRGTDGKVSRQDLKERIQYLKQLYSAPNKVSRPLHIRFHYGNVKLSDDEIDTIRQVIANAGFKFANERFVKEISELDIDLLARLCQLRSSPQTNNDAYMMDLIGSPWVNKVTYMHHGPSKVRVMRIPAGTILCRGTFYNDNTQVNDMHLPVYFAQMSTAAAYAFGVDYRDEANNRTGEQGKVRFFEVRDDLYILDVSDKANWKSLIPTEYQFRKKLTLQQRQMIQKTYNYAPRWNKPIIRRSNVNIDQVSHEYLCQRCAELDLDGFGNKEIPGLHDEIILCNKDALSKLKVLPYELVMKNELFNKEDNSLKCLYLKKDSQYVAAVDYTEVHSEISPSTESREEGPVDLGKLKQMCALRDLGNRAKDEHSNYE